MGSLGCVFIKCFSCVLMKAHVVGQTAGATLHGDVHFRTSVLTTSINHQSNFIFLLRHLLISPRELMHDISADRLNYSCEKSRNSIDAPNTVYVWHSVLLDQCLAALP